MVDFWPKNGHLARILPILDFNYRFLKIYKIECLEPHSGPNGLKISTHTLRDSFKKFIYQIFDILFFRDFLAPKSPKIAVFRRFLPILHFRGPKNREKLKYQKSCR